MVDAQEAVDADQAQCHNGRRTAGKGRALGGKADEEERADQTTSRETQRRQKKGPKTQRSSVSSCITPNGITNRPTWMPAPRLPCSLQGRNGRTRKSATARLRMMMEVSFRLSLGFVKMAERAAEFPSTVNRQRRPQPTSPSCPSSSWQGKGGGACGTGGGPEEDAVVADVDGDDGAGVALPRRLRGAAEEELEVAPISDRRRLHTPASTRTSTATWHCCKTPFF